MNNRALMISGLALVLAGTAACAEGYGYRGGLAAGYGGYYDDYYGPVYDGYWRNDGFFYYRSARRGPWVRDDGNHFRRDSFNGYHQWSGRRGGRR